MTDMHDRDSNVQHFGSGDSKLGYFSNNVYLSCVTLFVHFMLYILTSIWVLHTQNAGPNILFLCFSHVLQDLETKMTKEFCINVHYYLKLLNEHCNNVLVCFSFI